MKRDAIDFHAVRDIHEPIHLRLLNWARVVRVNALMDKPAPMFQHYRSSEVWAEQTRGIPADLLDGWQMERSVSRLPGKQRDAVRWYYVKPSDPYKQARKLAVSRQGLFDLVDLARTMLKNTT